MTDKTLLEHALTWHAHGYTPVPINTDGQKRPIGTWKHLQQAHPTADHVRAAFTADTDGIGLICGATSGNLEMLEFEGRAVTENLLPQAATLTTDNGLADVWDRLQNGYVELTPSGGIHWYFRVDGPPARNTKIARRPATPDELATNPNERIHVLIETRGEGGFTVIAPSAGRTHPTGRPWTAINGTPATVPTLTIDERDALYAVLNMLDQTPAIDAPAPTVRALNPDGTDKLRPGDDYNQRATWDDILTPHGWTKTKTFGATCRGWTRPGKNARDGISATTGRNDADNLYVFTSSTEFDTEKPYSKFAAYTLLEHAGDWTAAARTLAAEGFGDQTPISPGNNLPDLEDLATPRPTLTVVDGATARVIEPLDAPRLAARYGPTEDGVARAIADANHHQLRYCPQNGKWLTWTGARWAWDDAGHHREIARTLARDLPEGDGWKTFKKRALSASGISGIIRLAETDARLVTHIDTLDARPYELNTPGGIIDLRTGTLRPADAAALHTRTTGATPDFNTTSPLLEDFLHTTFGGDRDLIAYIQRLLGLSAIGTVREQILPFGQGAGANGKSTLLETAMHALGRGEGGYAISAPSEMLMVRKHSEHPAEIAQLAGARMVVCSELDDGQRFAEARIKQLTGRDSINARFMRRDPFTFTPSHTFWLLGNHKPTAATGGPAFWRRIQLLPFDHVVPEALRDPALGEKLEAEAGAFLAWIARGAADYLANGLRIPGAVKGATEAYALDQDTTRRFVEEACFLDNSKVSRTPVSDIRDAYDTWCREAGETPVSARRLTQELRDRYGIESIQSHGRRYYAGIQAVPTDGDNDTKEWFK